MSDIAPFTKVLFLEANPETETHLRINKEIREVKDALRFAKHPDRLEINQLGAVRTKDIVTELLQYKPRIVHFSGHGEEASIESDGGLILEEEIEVRDAKEEVKDRGERKRVENDDEQAIETEEEQGEEEKQDKYITQIIYKIVSPEEVATLFEKHGSSVECVIFNGCYTKETAKEVSRHVRFSIGMKRKIRDEDAINFSKYFYLNLGLVNDVQYAFEEARKHISDPSLPKLYINKKISPLPYYEPRWIIVSSFISALAVILVRLFGGLQGLEIGFLDHLQTSWSREKDDRVLVIQATNEDVRLQQEKGESVIGSFSNKTLADLLEKLKPLEPAAIGFDVYRENALNENLQEDQRLKALLTQDNLFGVCKLSVVEEGGINEPNRTVFPAIPPPPDLPKEQVGFSDFSPDKDTVIRRHLLGEASDRIRGEEDCTVNESFSLRLANHYLESQGSQKIRLDLSDGKFCQIILPNGQTRQSISYFYGGYQAGWYSSLGGCQVMLKYGIDHASQTPAETYTVQEVLEGSLEGTNLKDRIVLIGVARTDGARDYWNTPYNMMVGNQMPGVMLQAQMVSQLLDAALEGSPLIWVMPFWGEWLWIILWSSVGGIIIWKIQSPPVRNGALVSAAGTGYLICFLVFQNFYGWLPFVPLALVLVANPLSNWLVDAARMRLYKIRKGSS